MQINKNDYINVVLYKRAKKLSLTPSQCSKNMPYLFEICKMLHFQRGFLTDQFLAVTDTTVFQNIMQQWDMQGYEQNPKYNDSTIHSQHDC